jgi:hypothetical protein
MLTPNQLRQAMITKAGKRWNTTPERRFNEYQISRHLSIMQNQTVTFDAIARDGGPFPATFQLDFARPRDWDCYSRTGFHDEKAGFSVDYEIDGEGHKDKNDPWKDSIKNANGLKVIHIPGWLCHKDYWGNLDCAIPKALASKKMTIHLEEIA